MENNCCTPKGQIKRYVNCVGCDKKPKQETLEEVVLDYFLSTSSIIIKDIKDYDEPQAIRLLEECGFEKQEEMYSEEELKKVLTEIMLINPSHLSLLRSGYGEFPDSYELTEKGVNYIIEQFKKK